MPRVATGVHTVTMKLKDGTVRVYRYHRETRRKIHTSPGDPGHKRELARAASPPPGDKRVRATVVGAIQKHGFVYFIAADALGLIKIGWSKHVDRRLKSMQSGSPVKLRLVATIPAVPQDEVRLHAQFAHLRQGGEWFTLSDEISEHVASL